MPELVYNVKFKIDTAIQEGSTGISAYKERVEELESQIKSLTGAQEQFNKSAKNTGSQVGQMNKQVAVGNQLFFSLSDGIQDATQFSYGFGTGMRAVGNNIGFTAELAGSFIQRVKEMNGGVLTMTGLLKGLGSSFLGVGGVILAINTAITVITTLSMRQEQAARSTKALTDETLNLARSAFGQLNYQSLEAQKEIEILSSILDENKKTLEDFKEETIDVTRFQQSFVDVSSDATRVFSQYNQAANDAVNEVNALKIAEQEAAKARKDSVLEVVRQRLAELEATQLIRDTMRELGVIQIASPFEADMISDVLPMIEDFNDQYTFEQKKMLTAVTEVKNNEAEVYDEIERRKLESFKKRSDKEVDIERLATGYKLDAYMKLASSIGDIGESVFGQSKALAIAETIVNTYLAAQKAAASAAIGGPIASKLAAAAEIAAGIARVAQIKKTTIESGSISEGASSGAKFGFQMNAIEGAQTFRTPAFMPSDGSRSSQPKIDVRVMADRKQLYAIVKQGEEEYRQIKV